MPPSVWCAHAVGGNEIRASLERAGVKRICAEADLTSRESLAVPGITPRVGLASPTRIPWIVANGWRFTRNPGGKYVYELPAGKAALAAAEAYAYGADVALKIEASDATALAAMSSFLEGIPPADLPGVADLAVVDDGSALTGEVMNLLARRNLLYQVGSAPSARFRINIAVGSSEYPREEAADPSAFALKIRRQITDDQRTLRLFGSEVVICRLTGDDQKLRLHLINYGGRDIEGLRIRIRGSYSNGVSQVAGAGRRPLQDYVSERGATEFSVPILTTYGVVDLER
jgi:hypothetical protein